MNNPRVTSLLRNVLLVLLVVLAVPVYALDTTDSSVARDSSEVLQGFHEIEEERRQANELTTQEKHRIMFYMGIALLVLLLFTAYFGIATGVQGKPLFVPHMVCAGLSVTLAIAHSVVAIVWFYPFK